MNVFTLSMVRQCIGLCGVVVIILMSAITAECADSYTFEVQSQELRLKSNGTDGVLAEIDGFVSQGVPGAPLLPRKSYELALPPDVDFNSVTVEITPLTMKTLDGSCDLAPAGPAATWSRGSEEQYDWGNASTIIDGRNTNIYDSNQYFPQNNIHIARYSQMRKWKFVSIEFTPVSYNPVTQTIRQIFNASVTVSWSRTGIMPADTVLADTVRDDTARTRFINFGEAISWYRLSRALTGPRTVYDYVIITTNAVESASTTLDNFVLHKENLGFSVLVVTEDDYGGLTGPPPNGTAEKIRQWLIDNWSVYTIEYVALIGNPKPYFDCVPSKQCWPRYHEGDNRDAVTDYYYADLTGDWDLDGDEFYGEYYGDFAPGGVDFEAEVYVGRIVYYDNIGELDQILQKTIDYQTAEGDLSWRTKILLPESFYSPSTDGAELANEMITQYLGTAGIETYSLYEQGTCIDDSIFDSDEELLNLATTLHWKNNPYGMVTWCGHGWSGGVGIGYDQPGHDCHTLIDLSTASTLNDNYPAIVISTSCLNSYPEKSSNLGYYLLRHGAIGMVGASRVSFYSVGWTAPSGNLSSMELGLEINRYLVDSEFPIGRALAEAKSVLNPVIGSYLANGMMFNLYGDPQVHYSQQFEGFEYFVDHTYGSDSNSGLNWGNAFATVQHAIDQCTSGAYGYPDVIHVTEGTYFEDLVMDYGIMILGGYPAGGGSRDPAVYYTLIDGSGANPTVTCSGKMNVTLDGLYIVNGEGIRIYGSQDVKISHSTITGHSNTERGGIEINTSTVSLELCTIFNNYTPASGGGVLCENAQVTLTNCLLYDNSADDGGAIACFDCNPQITNCTLTENTAASDGGGLWGNPGANPFLGSCIVWGNTPNSITAYAGSEYSDIEGSWPGTGNINADPLFVSGPRGSYYLSQTLAGQPANSPCKDTGGHFSDSVCFHTADLDLCMNALTTRTDQVADTGYADMGYHYLHESFLSTPTPTPTPTSTPTPTPTPQYRHVPDDYGTIQAAIDAANNGDIVLVGSGIYTGPGNKDLECGSKDILVTSEFGSEYTTIDCEGSGRGFYFYSNDSVTAVIDGFTIRNGNMTGTYPDNSGGGIAIFSGQPTIRNCVLTQCTAEVGGGLYCSSGDPIIQNCRFTTNAADSGAGLTVSLSEMIMVNCEFDSNIASIKGGGIYTLFGTTSTPQIASCTIHHNAAPIGGGIYCWESYGPFITNCLIHHNDADQGGAIYCDENAEPFLLNCTSSDNRADLEGGGIYCDSDDEPVFTNCIFWGDMAGAGEPEVYTTATGSLIIEYSDVGLTAGVYPGTGNINADPLFTTGKFSDYYLEQSGNPCINSGHLDAVLCCFETIDEILCMNQLSTAKNGIRDSQTVDMGMHYPRSILVPDDYSTLQSAIDAANTNDTILVADGTYTGHGNRDLEFRGKAITMQSINGPVNCIIDCESLGRGVYFHEQETPDTLFSGFTITNGEATAAGMYSGGAILCSSASPTIDGCIITGNHAQQSGGGITFFLSDAVVTDCYVLSNSADQRGGGIYFNLDCDAVVSSCIVYGNTAPIGGGVSGYNSGGTLDTVTVSQNTATLYGGGIHLDTSDPVVTGCLIDQNSCSAENGGGIYANDSYPLIASCTITNNTAPLDGGGLYLTNTDTLSSLVTDCRFEGNTAENGGAITIADTSAAVKLTDLVVTDNDASDNGGGIYLLNALDVIVANCLFDHNQGDLGAGIRTLDSNLSLTSSTLTENHALDIAGGLYGRGNSVILENVIIWNNTSVVTSPDLVFYQCSASVTYSCIEDGYAGTGNIDLNPEFTGGILGDYYLEDAFDLASPCRDTGIGFASTTCFQSASGSNCLDKYVTSADQTLDSGTVDMGYHYPRIPTHYVPQDYATIQAAIDAAGNGEMVRVADGIYSGTGNKDLDYSGKSIIVTSENGPAYCTIDCENSGRGVHFHTGETSDAVFDGFTVINGYDSEGGAIYCTGASPVISNCHFTANGATMAGGAVYCDGGAAPIISECVIYNNGCDLYCSGFYFYQSTASVYNCLFYDNTGDIGAGMYLSNCLPGSEILNCTFDGNIASSDGGALYCDNSNPTVTNCIMWFNYDTQIKTVNSTPDVTYCAIQGGYPGTGNITANPMFVQGPMGDNYLDTDSNCIDHGADPADSTCFPMWYKTSCLERRTTDISNNPDTATVDMGYHYPLQIVHRVPSEHINIQYAINAAHHSDMVLVEDGTYTGFGNTNLDFLGKRITVQSENGPDACIIDCELSSRGFYLHSGETRDSIINGFTIQNGSVNASTADDHGGAIRLVGASPRITNCKFYGNFARLDGGAISCESGADPLVNSCFFSDNETLFNGGGMSVDASAADIMNCLFEYNTARVGGGISLDGCSGGTGIRNCTFVQCATTEGYGASIYCDTCDPSISNSILWDGVGGDEIDVYSASPMVAYCDVMGGYPGTANMDLYPEFIESSFGEWLLDDSIDAISPCIDAGDDDADYCYVYQGYAQLSMYDFTTSPRAVFDAETVDMGYHYPIPLCLNHGDVDGNGSITAGDAQITFNIVLGLYTPTYTEECAADCNGSGNLTAADAQNIFMTVLGLDTCVDAL